MKVFLIYVTAAFFCCKSVAQTPTTSFNVDGIQVIFKPTVKEIINVSMYFRGGVTNYSSQKAGIENFALMAATECGTKLYSKNAFKNIQDEYGIAISGSSTYDYGTIELNCIAKYLNQGWKLFDEAINNPVFDKREIELVKSKLISGIKQSDSDPDGHIEDLAMKDAFKNTPYAIDPKGTEGLVQSFNQGEIAAYYRNLLNKRRMFLVVVGKISKEDLVKKIHDSFSGLPDNPYQPTTLTAPQFIENTAYKQIKQLATNYIAGVINAPKMSSPEYVPHRLAISFLSGGLFRELRTRLNLSYNPGASVTLLQMPYSTVVASTTDPVAAVEAIVAQIKLLKSGTINEESLKYLKGSYITNNYMKLESSGAIASGLGQAEIMGGWKLSETLPEKVKEATPQQVLDAARKYITGIKWAYLGVEQQSEKTMQAFKMLTN